MWPLQAKTLDEQHRERRHRKNDREEDGGQHHPALEGGSELLAAEQEAERQHHRENGACRTQREPAGERGVHDGGIFAVMWRSGFGRRLAHLAANQD